MNKRNHIRTVLSIVLVFFLFVPIVIRSLPTHSNNHARCIGLHKVSSTPTKADIQIPYEEKEKEEEIGSDSASALFYFFLPSELVHSGLIKDSCFAYNTTKPLSSPIPLYLAKRSILI